MSAFIFWYIQIPGWLLLAYLIVAQCLPAFNYELGVRMGTQEPATNVTDVGVAFWKGFCGADLVGYAPLLALGLTGHFMGQTWGLVALSAALGITVYWPVVCLWTVAAAKGAKEWSLPNERQYWVVLPLIAIWGATALAGLLHGL